MTNSKLSILLLTYDHEKFLSKAFEGILAQKVNFKYEIHVALDLSPDRSLEIIEGFQNRCPDRIFVHAATKRLGGKANMLQGYRHLQGEYVCVLDGDDYWSDPDKLQSQVDFLETHSDYVGVAHNTLLLREKDGEQSIPVEKMIRDGFKETHTVSDLVTGDSYFHISSLLWRNVFRGELPEAAHHEDTGDWLISMLYAEHGKIHYDSRAMSVYRVHPKGVWSRQSEIKRAMDNVDGMALYNRLLKYKYQKEYARIWWASDSLLKSLKEKKIGWPFRQKYFFLKQAASKRGRRRSIKNRISWYLYQEMKKIASRYEI
jgi:glycosyltransferase involved in cell wall biosynthesis